MILPPFDSPQWDESNDIKFTEIQSLDQFPILKIIKWFLNRISVNIDARDMKIPPFDAHRLGESNELLYTFLRSLDGEIFTF